MGQGDARHVAAMAHCEALGERAPAATDLQHLIARSHVEKRDRAVELRDLSLLQRLGGAAIERGRIVHPLVEPAFVEVIAEVVMGLDISAAAPRRVGACGVVQAHGQPAERQALPGGLKRGLVALETVEQRHKIRGRPIAIHIGLGKPDIAAHDHAPERAPALEIEPGVRTRTRAVMLYLPAQRQRDRQRAGVEGAQQAPEHGGRQRFRRQSPGRSSAQRAGARALHIVTTHVELRGIVDAGMAVAVSSGAVGFGWRRTPFSQSRRASQ